MGLVLVAASLAARVVAEPRTWKRAALTLVACIVAVTATPFGTSFWIEIPRSLARIQLYPLDEWKRPELLDLRMLPFWGIAAAFCVATVMHRRRILERQPGEAPIVATALILLPAAIAARRNVGPFLMVAIPVLTLLLDRRDRRTQQASPNRPIMNVALAATATVLVIAKVAWAYHHEIPRLRWRPVPAPAVAALSACPGNLYNRYDEGGELLWFAPARRVFLDGRQDPFPPALVLEHIRVEVDGADYRPVFARHDIKCAYLPTISPTAMALTAAGWMTLYRDNRRVVLRAN
jgi:hypothetical protein